MTDMDTVLFTEQSLYPREILHLLHFLHPQAQGHDVKVLVKVLSYRLNLHRRSKLIVKVVTVVTVFDRIRRIPIMTW